MENPVYTIIELTFDSASAAAKACQTIHGWVESVPRTDYETYGWLGYVYAAAGIIARLTPAEASGCDCGYNIDGQLISADAVDAAVVMMTATDSTPSVAGWADICAQHFFAANLLFYTMPENGKPMTNDIARAGRWRIDLGECSDSKATQKAIAILGNQRIGTLTDEELVELAKSIRCSTDGLDEALAALRERGIEACRWEWACIGEMD